MSKLFIRISYYFLFIALFYTCVINSEEDLSVKSTTVEPLEDDVGNNQTEPTYVLRVVYFVHQKCNESSEDLINIDDISLVSNWTSDKAEVMVNFSAEALVDIDEPIRLELYMGLRLNDFLVIPFPCVNGFGSCEYDDVCALAHETPCPDFIQEEGFQCQCPIKQGNYSVSDLSFELPTTLTTGDFLIQANITHGSRSVACEQIFLQLRQIELDAADDNVSVDD